MKSRKGTVHVIHIELDKLLQLHVFVIREFDVKHKEGQVHHVLACILAYSTSFFAFNMLSFILHLCSS